ncbi:MAG TPA: hypothetical protein V6C84_03895 [Coleofasciculaceae cyanobacterium]|jgi:hypothetical protein
MTTASESAFGEPLNSLNAQDSLPYAAIRRQIQPGDVFAFSGTDFPSQVVKLATQSPYVHVAIVFSTAHGDRGEDSILIAESHIDRSLPSRGTGKPIRGAQFQWLSERLIACCAPVWWAALKTPLTVAQTAQMQSWLREIEQQQVPYDFVQAIEVGFTTLICAEFRNSPDYSALFCSELVTYALQQAGVVDETLTPADQLPADVMQFPCFNQPILIQA